MFFLKFLARYKQSIFNLKPHKIYLAKDKLVVDKQSYTISIFHFLNDYQAQGEVFEGVASGSSVCFFLNAALCQRGASPFFKLKRLNIPLYLKTALSKLAQRRKLKLRGFYIQYKRMAFREKQGSYMHAFCLAFFWFAFVCLGSYALLLKNYEKELMLHIRATDKYQKSLEKNYEKVLAKEQGAIFKHNQNIFVYLSAVDELSLIMPTFKLEYPSIEIFGFFRISQTKQLFDQLKNQEARNSLGLKSEVKRINTDYGLLILKGQAK
jgi:hypothetical protein